jgi:hypothetical protein
MLVLVFCVAGTMGCKKDKKVTPPVNLGDAALFSKWELRNQSGGLRPDVNYAPGNGNILQFNQDSTYTFFIGNAVFQHGVFHINEKTSMTEPDKFKYIYYDKETAGYPLVIRHDTLIIGNNAADGIESMYIKKQ